MADIIKEWLNSQVELSKVNVLLLLIAHSEL